LGNPLSDSTWRSVHWRSRVTGQRYFARECRTRCHFIHRQTYCIAGHTAIARGQIGRNARFHIAGSSASALCIITAYATAAACAPPTGATAATAVSVTSTRAACQLSKASGSRAAIVIAFVRALLSDRSAAGSGIGAVTVAIATARSTAGASNHDCIARRSTS
jgi:hypothetical protein